MLAAICRGLVETAAQEWAAGTEAPDVPTAMLRLATWQAAREGLSGQLLDAFTGRPKPCWEVVDALVEHITPALEAVGDLAAVQDGLARLREEGNGAIRQRRMFERTGQLVDVVAESVRATAHAAD